MNTYPINHSLRLQATFDVNGALTDPTTVTFKMRVPAGTVTTYVYGVNAELVREGLGTYYVDYTITGKGTHTFRFEGTGACVAANEQQFLALDSQFQ